MQSTHKDSRAAKAIRSVVTKLATDLSDSTCQYLIHQPKEPKNFAERLKAMRQETVHG